MESNNHFGFAGFPDPSAFANMFNGGFNSFMTNNPSGGLNINEHNKNI